MSLASATSASSAWSATRNERRQRLRRPPHQHNDLRHLLLHLLHLLHQVNPGKIISKVDPHHIIKTIHSRTSQYEARNSPKCSPQISPMKSHERKVSAFELKVREARRRGEAGPVQRSYSI